ncbi:MAG: acyl carrier protein [Caldisericia bacterium]|nr:acyl carrier protein [Caldisericia bacterium]
MTPIVDSKLESEIRCLVAEILEMDESKITPDAKFVDDLGMDSMMALEILASVEKKYKIKIPEEYLTKVTSLKSMVEIAKKLINK